MILSKSISKDRNNNMQNKRDLAYKTRGVSMEPMLRQNRDLVVIQVPFLRVRRFDVDGVVKKIMGKKV